MKERVALLYICTGNYQQLFQQFYDSAERNFLPEIPKRYYVWTDSQCLGDYDPEKVTIIPKAFQKWPSATLLRYHDFTDIREVLLENHEIVYFCNADLNIFAEVGEEILPDNEHPLVGVRHIQYDRPQLLIHQLKENTEQNIYSNAYIDPEEIPYTYIFGCFNGGRVKEFIEMSETIVKWTNEDLTKGIIPVWHDESYLNAYRIAHPNLFKILPVQYSYPDLCGVEGYDDIKIVKIDKESFFESVDYRNYDKRIAEQFDKERVAGLLKV